MKISVILPVYNSEDYLAETIESVLNQTMNDFEFIIVDHAITDGSKVIINKYAETDHRISVINLGFNKGGPAYPRNEGIKSAQGEYIAFIDSDDVWLPQKLEQQLHFMEKRDLNFSSSNIYVIDKNSKQLLFLSFLFRVKLFYRSFFHSQKAFVMNNFIVLASVIVKRELIELFNEDKDYIAAEDYDLWLRLLGNDRIFYGLDRTPLIKYRFMSNSLSEIGGYQQQARALHSTIEYILLENRLELYNCIRVTLTKKMIFSWLLSVRNKIIG